MSDLGKRGENLVAQYYQKLGFEVLDRNFKPKFGKQMGELDLVMRKNREIVFVEVKTRRNEKFGSPFDAVDFYKQRKLVKTAKLYMQNPKYSDFDFRIDVAAVDIDNKNEPVIILENAIGDVN